MIGSECIQWIKKENLYELAEKHYTGVKKVFTQCLKVKKGDNVLIIGDTGLKQNNLSAVLALCYYLYCKKKGVKVEMVLQESKALGEPADIDVVNYLKNLKENSVIMLSLSNRFGKLNSIKSFRKFCRQNGHRFTSTVSLGYIPTEYVTQVISTININYRELRRRLAKVIELLEGAKEVKIVTDSGTDLVFNVDGRQAIASGGDFSEPGTGGNIPSGEVYIAPVEGTANGTLVIDASSRNRHKTELIREPIIIKIRKGRILSIKGEVEADLLKESFDWARERAKYPDRVDHLCELGIGMNKHAKVIGTTIIDEKARGTAHIAFGSNYWFGGTVRTIIHLDQVFRDPAIYVDGIRLPL